VITGALEFCCGMTCGVMSVVDVSWFIKRVVSELRFCTVDPGVVCPLLYRPLGGQFWWAWCHYMGSKIDIYCTHTLHRPYNTEVCVRDPNIKSATVLNP